MPRRVKDQAPLLPPPVLPLPRSVLGVDPGDVHVGWAILTDRGDGWQTELVVELTPEEATIELAALVYTNAMEAYVVEEYRLYPNKAMTQTGSTMPTAELIGAFKYLHAVGARRHQDIGGLVMQPASIKKPTVALMKRRGIAHEAVTQRRGGHAKDAETHAWHYVLRTLKEGPQ